MAYGVLIIEDEAILASEAGTTISRETNGIIYA